MASSSSNWPSLTILGGPMAGKRLVLQEAVDNILVGSDPSCGFHLPLPGVNPIHARIFVDAEGITVLDANSPRGIYVNDDRVTGQVPIRNGDILWLGAPGDSDVVMILCRVPPEGEPPASTHGTLDETETLLLARHPPRSTEPAGEVAPEDEPSAFEMVADQASGFDVALPEEPAGFDAVPETAAEEGPATRPMPAHFEESREEPKPYVPGPRVPAPKPTAAMPPRKAGAPSSVGLYAGLAVMGVLMVGGGIFAALRFMKSSPPAGDATATTLPETTLTTQPTAGAPTPEPVTTPEPAEEAVTVVEPTPTPSPKVAEAGGLKPTVAPPTPAAKPTPPPPTPAAKPTPPPSAQARGPSPEELKAQQLAAQVADLLGQADAELVGHKYEAAAGLYDRVLKLDPQNAKAGAGRTAALAGAAVAKKTFVAGRTTVQSGKAAKGGVSGFDDADVSVAKAPDYWGRIEFEASPRNVKPGDSFAVKVYLVNEGKKPFKISGLTIATVTNSARTGGGPAAPPTKEVEPKGRVLLQDVPGVWQDGVNTWSMEVVVTSNQGDTFKSQLTWR